MSTFHGFATFGAGPVAKKNISMPHVAMLRVVNLSTTNVFVSYLFNVCVSPGKSGIYSYRCSVLKDAGLMQCS